MAEKRAIYTQSTYQLLLALFQIAFSLDKRILTASYLADYQYNTPIYPFGRGKQADCRFHFFSVTKPVNLVSVNGNNIASKIINHL